MIRKTVKNKMLECGLDIRIPDDVNFLSAALGLIPAEHHDWLITNYIKRWLETIEDLRNEGVQGHKWHNAGRFAANEWLRYVLNKRGLGKPDTSQFKRVR